jgi:hypothetical protein
MWLIGGSKTTARRVKNGRSARRLCEECNVVAVFDEHELTDKFNAFFVELYQTTQPRMVCSECGADRDVDELLAAPAPADTPASKPTPAVLPRAAAPSKPAELPQKPEADVDEMLAALKRKIAKK